MTEPLALTMGQQFEIERFNRTIDQTGGVPELRAIAKQLLQAWQTQKAATQWVMRQQLGAPTQFGLSDMAGDFKPNRSTKRGGNPPTPPKGMDIL